MKAFVLGALVAIAATVSLGTSAQAAGTHLCNRNPDSVMCRSTPVVTGPVKHQRTAPARVPSRIPVVVAPAKPLCSSLPYNDEAYGICGRECRATHTSGGGISNSTCEPDCMQRFCTK